MSPVSGFIMTKSQFTRSQIQKCWREGVTVKAALDVTKNMTVVEMVIHWAEVEIGQMKLTLKVKELSY